MGAPTVTGAPPSISPYGQQPYPYSGPGAPVSYPYPGPSPYSPPSGGTPPANWTGGVLPGPLAPMPGSWDPGHPNQNGETPGGGQPGGSWNGNGHGNGVRYTNGHAANGAPRPTGYRGATDPTDGPDGPADPWAPPGDQRR